MADITTVLGLPFPEGADANDVPADMQALAERIDEVPGIESLTSAEIAALAAGEKPAGRVVYNSTTSKLQVSNGSSFSDVKESVTYAIGTRDGALTLAAYSDTTVTYTAEADPSSMLNTGTGIVTLPSAGLWLLTGSALDSNATGGTSRLRLWHGSTEVATQSLSETASATAVVYAAASDTVKMSIFNDSSAKAATVARFTVVKIGL